MREVGAPRAFAVRKAWLVSFKERNFRVTQAKHSAHKVEGSQKAKVVAQAAAKRGGPYVPAY